MEWKDTIALAFLATCITWSAGEVVRFTVFTIDNAAQFFGGAPEQVFEFGRAHGAHKNKNKIAHIVLGARTVRYGLGAVIFPIGAACEWVLVLQALLLQLTDLAGDAADSSVMTPWMGLLCLLIVAWPAGLYVLLKSLLSQKRKHAQMVLERRETVKMNKCQ